MQVLLLCNYTLQLLSSFSSFEESTNVPSIFASGSVRSLVGTLMAASPHRASPGGAGGPAPRPPAAAPRARVVLPSWAQGKEFRLYQAPPNVALWIVLAPHTVAPW
jgi:hypothetical protein